ncbi:hypothetical protein AHF37_12189 [Paragonimus kellicotti]|nr:hypothetical protein AHF37_12189 [Paragonimus kellicotti]
MKRSHRCCLPVCFMLLCNSIIQRNERAHIFCRNVQSDLCQCCKCY